MEFNSPATELTTAATDVVLGLVCLLLIVWLHDLRARYPWKIRLWSSMFLLLALASFLGVVVHGLVLSPAVRSFLWQPLYLALGIGVSLFFVGAMFDWRGESAARKACLAIVAAGVLLYLLSRVFHGVFLIFVIFEGLAVLAALIIYLFLAIRRRTPGASTIALAIVLSMFAAWLQTTSIHFTLIWPFDHNSVFHLVQAAAFILLGRGLRTSCS